MSTEEKKEVPIQRLPTMGSPMSNRGARWKPRITVSDHDLRALQKTIQKADKKKNSR
jgi:hypothetical protein